MKGNDYNITCLAQNALLADGRCRSKLLVEVVKWVN